MPAQTAQVVETPLADEGNNNNNNDGGILGMDRQTMGLVLILICGAGLALVVLGSMNRDKGKGKQATAQIGRIRIETATSTSSVCRSFFYLLVESAGFDVLSQLLIKKMIP